MGNSKSFHKSWRKNMSINIMRTMHNSKKEISKKDFENHKKESENLKTSLSNKHRYLH